MVIITLVVVTTTSTIIVVLTRPSLSIRTPSSTVIIICITVVVIALEVLFKRVLLLGWLVASRISRLLTILILMLRVSLVVCIHVVLPVAIGAASVLRLLLSL